MQIETDLRDPTIVTFAGGSLAETARVAVAMLRQLWPAKLPAPLLSSFKDASLAAARESAPEFARALLIDEMKDDWQVRAEAVSAAGINTSGKRLTIGCAPL